MKVQKYAIEAPRPRVRPARPERQDAPEGETQRLGPAPAPKPSRTAQAMNAGAGIVDPNESAALAICRELVNGEDVRLGGKVRYKHLRSEAFQDHSFYLQGVEGAQIARRNVRRDVVWAVHELRDMGHLSRDLVETAERFLAMHLRLEPRAKSALLGEGVRGGETSPHRALLARSALSERVDELYEVVGRKLGARGLAIFAMAFDPMRPSVSEIRGAAGCDFATLCDTIETGLMKLWALEPIIPAAHELNQRFRAVNELARI